MCTTANPVVISKKVWDKLSADQQKMVREASDQSRGPGAQKSSRGRGGRFSRKELEAKGMLVNDVPAATWHGCAELTKPSSTSSRLRMIRQ
jgi:TRAP-type C4-dicarboxylate transport system substrate-binding protein